MSIKDLFASVDDEVETDVEEVEETEEESASAIAELFPKVFELVNRSIDGDGEEEASLESIKEDYDHDSNPEVGDDDPVSPDEHLTDWGTDVVLYPERDNGLSWSQTFKDRAGNCTVSLSSTLALETMQLDEAAKREVLEKMRQSTKVYALPEEQDGFTSRTSLIESNMVNPERVVVVDESDYIDADGDYVERRAFVDSLRERGAVVVNSVEAAADYVSTYLY